MVGAPQEHVRARSRDVRGVPREGGGGEKRDAHGYERATEGEGRVTTIPALTAAVLTLVPHFAKTPHGRIEILHDCTHIIAYAVAYHFDPELIAAIVMAESTFDRHAKNPKDSDNPTSFGLMGLNHATEAQRTDYVANIWGGVKLLREYVDYCRGDIDGGLTVFHAGWGTNGDKRKARAHCKPSAYSREVRELEAQLVTGSVVTASNSNGVK